MQINNLAAIKNILLFFLFITIFVIMSQLSAILIPFVLSLLLAFSFQPLIILLKNKRIPDWLIVPIVAIISGMIIYGIYEIVSSMYFDILDNKEYLLTKLSERTNELITFLNNFTGTSFNIRFSIEEFYKLFDDDLISKYGSKLANILGSFTGSFVLFLVFYILILFGITNYKRYLNFVAGDVERNVLLSNFETVQRAIYSYIIIKILISLITGFIVFITCLIFQINFALFWGFLIFIMNFIPSIGSIVGSIPPILMCFIQYDSFNITILFFIIIASLQFMMGNFIEPRILGSRLQLNTLTVVFGLVFWGYLWGIPGMLVAVPLLVLMKLIFEQFPSTRILARIMGTSKLL
jgi:predicted PurR-regulated permease PerM